MYPPAKNHEERAKKEESEGRDVEGSATFFSSTTT